MKKAIDKLKWRKEKTEGKLVKIPFLCMTVFFFSCFFRIDAFAEGKWVEVSGAWQYQENGVARKGWLHLGDSWYYLDPTRVSREKWRPAGPGWTEIAIF